jgi:hypothetical protein
MLSFFFAAALTASAQRFSFGVKAGVPVTSALPNYAGATGMVDTGRWTVGPTVEVRLFDHLSFEFDALYRGYRQQQSFGAYFAIQSGANSVPIVTVPVYVSARQDAKEWDLPLLLKYRFHAGPVHPFVDAGFEFAHVSSDFTSTQMCLGTSDACSAAGVVSYAQNGYTSGVNRRGPAAGAGMEFKYGRVRIAPEVRYTKLTQPTANEATVLVGFTF